MAEEKKQKTALKHAFNSEVQVFQGAGLQVEFGDVALSISATSATELVAVLQVVQQYPAIAKILRGEG
jgi:hypothetical protein